MASNMLFTFVIGQCFTTMLCSMRYGVFLFFAGMKLCRILCNSWQKPLKRSGHILLLDCCWPSLRALPRGRVRFAQSIPVA